MRFPVSRRGLLLALVILLLYVLFLVVRIPAVVALDYAATGFPVSRYFQYQDLRGTLWRATASNVRVNRVYLGKLDWNINPLYLLLGSVHADIDFRSADGYGNAEVSMGLGGSTKISTARVNLPIASLTPLMYGLPLKTDGELALLIDDLHSVPGERLNIDGKIVWTNAAIQFRESLKLGDLSMVLTAAEKGSRGILSDAGGPLIVEGTLQLNPDGRYQLNMKLAARDKSDRDLNSSLAMLGRADQQGKVSFNYNGVFRF